MIDLGPLRSSIENRLAGPVNDYFAYLEEQQAKEGGLLSNLIRRLRLIRARAALSSDLKTIIRDAHMEAAVAGNDGAPFPAALRRLVKSRIADSEKYLAAYMRALPEMTKLAAVARIVTYSAAIMQTASAVSSEGAGKPKLPIYPGDRSLADKGFCKCYLDWQKVPGGYDVFWRLTAAEPCEDCKALNKRWNPLRVRGGQIQDKAIKALHAEYILRKAASL